MKIEKNKEIYDENYCHWDHYLKKLNYILELVANNNNLCEYMTSSKPI